MMSMHTSFAGSAGRENQKQTKQFFVRQMKNWMHLPSKI